MNVHSELVQAQLEHVEDAFDEGVEHPIGRILRHGNQIFFKAKYGLVNVPHENDLAQMSFSQDQIDRDIYIASKKSAVIGSSDGSSWVETGVNLDVPISKGAYWDVEFFGGDIMTEAGVGEEAGFTLRVKVVGPGGTVAYPSTETGFGAMGFTSAVRRFYYPSSSFRARVWLGGHPETEIYTVKIEGRRDQGLGKIELRDVQLHCRMA